MTEAKEAVQAVESECYVIGACFWHHAGMSEVSDMLKPEHFYDPLNAAVWEAMLTVYSRGDGMDVATVLAEMKRTGTIDNEPQGMVAFRMSSLETKYIGKRNIMHHALIIAQCWVSREAFKIGAEAMDADGDGFDVATRMAKRAEEAMEGIAPRRSKSYADAERDELERMDAPKRKTHPTGFRSLDRVLGGHHRGDLVIIAARPAMGKSSFAISGILEAVDAGYPTGLFSLELNENKMQARLFSRRSGVPLAAIVRDEMTAAQITKRHEGLGGAGAVPLWIRYDTNVSLDDIRAETTRMVRQHGVGCVVIDQLNWIKPPKGANRDEVVGTITRGLKQMALQLDIAVVLLHQLNRGVETRGGDKRPVLSDLRDSGNVEQDAQVVLFLHRPEYYGITEDDRGSTIGVVNVIVAKNSNGPCETVRLRFTGETASVHEDEPSYDPRQGFNTNDCTSPRKDEDAPF